MNTFIILLAGLLPTYVIRFSLFGVPTNLFEAGVLILVVGMLCVPETRRQIVSTLLMLPTPFKVWVFLFLVAAVVSTIYSPVLRSSLGILKGWIVIPIMFGLLISVARYTDPLAHRKIIRSLAYSGLVIALLGLSQLNGFMRVSSIYDVPNSLALFLVPICVIAFWVGIRTQNRFYIGSAVIMFAAIVTTQSFGAIIALLGAIAIGLVWGRMKLKRAQLGIFFGVIVLIFALFFFSGRMSYLLSPFMNSNTSNSATVRLQLWDIGVRLIAQHPISGIGLGQFEGAYQAELHHLFMQQQLSMKPTFHTLIPEFVFRDPHNWIISFWLNVGLLGLASFIATIFTVLRNAGKWLVSSSEESYYVQGVLLAIVSILIFGLFDTVYWKNDLSALWWLLLGLFVTDRDLREMHF